MGDMTELLGVDSKGALRFFFKSLIDERLPVKATKEETLYVASILAHYAMTSNGGSGDITLPSSLSEIYDRFVLDGYRTRGRLGFTDPEILEMAGSQALLLCGFFRNQVSGERNIAHYDKLGRFFYGKAGFCSKEVKKRQLLRQISHNFCDWTNTCMRMSQTCRDSYYLLNKPRF